MGLKKRMFLLSRGYARAIDNYCDFYPLEGITEEVYQQKPERLASRVACVYLSCSESPR